MRRTKKENNITGLFYSNLKLIISGKFNKIMIKGKMFLKSIYIKISGRF